MRRLLALACLSALGGCSLLTAPEIDWFRDARPYVPEPVVREWWAQVEACSGLRGDYNRVSWFERDNLTHESNRMGVTLGRADPLGYRVVMLVGHRLDQLRVSHEMLHLLNGPGHGDVFRVKCAGVVA